MEKKTDKYMNENNTKVDMGEVSDGYHTFNELYEYRMLYNAALFNEFAKQNLYDVHKSRLHSDGTLPFDDPEYFIVVAELPTGQISNHYKMKNWDLFDIPVKDKANKYDGHSPKDVAERLREFLSPKPKWPKTPAECCKVLGISPHTNDVKGYKHNMLEDLQLLLICRDAYWKLAGDYNPNYVSGVDKFGVFNYDNEIQNSGPSSSWERHTNKILDFPSIEIRNIFRDNYMWLIERCKELL